MKGINMLKSIGYNPVVFNAGSKQNNTVQQENIYYNAGQGTLADEFLVQHKKNGLVERLYNGIKNLTGLGVGSKKVKAAIASAENGEINNDEARELISKYRNSQVNSAQIFGDSVSILASASTFFGLRKLLKKEAAVALLNEKTSDIAVVMKKNPKNIMLELGKSKGKMALVLAGAAGFAGMFTKVWAGKINRIGSKEFATDKNDFNNLATEQDRQAYKYQKKLNRKAKRNANRRNRFSGFFNGLMMPVTLVGGAIAGVPLYLAGNSLNRYYIGNFEEKNKSFKGYINNLKNDVLLHGALAVGMAIPLLRKGRFASEFDINLKKSVDSLKNAVLHDHEYKSVSTYKELDGILMNSSEISRIMQDSSLSMDEMINKLTNENIFAVKFKQISNDGSSLANALKEDCPPTRCFKTDKGWDYSKAQQYIDNNLGSGYKIIKSLGAGTIAETYLAKSPDGKEVCLKVLKEGITKEKIAADEAKFIEMINKLNNKTADEKAHLIKNIRDLAESVGKEVNFESEMIGAQELKKYTNFAKIVNPIEVKNGVYVMEKAEGISLASLVELNSAKNYRDLLIKDSPWQYDFRPKSDSKLGRLLADAKTKEEKINILDKYIEKVEGRTPQYGDISLSKDDFKFLIEEYQQVLTEQFYKIGKDGKVMHGDIHPGNIFVNIDALREARKHSKNPVTMISSQLGKRKSNQIFTLIDPGNYINQLKEHALSAMRFSSYLKNGNVQDITEYVLEGAVLPQGMTHEQAKEVISKELKKIFFDYETRLEPITSTSILDITSAIMKKHKIIPADTQLTFNKAIQSSDNSLDELYKSMIFMGLKDIKSVPDALKFLGSLATDAAMLRRQHNNMIANQEKLNQVFLSPEQITKLKKNPNMLKTNSEEYLTYTLKQRMNSIFKDPNAI